MAPGTHAGAASPLIAVGGVPLNVDEVLKRKILNDATAFLRSYAGKRGRNVELAETAVTEGKAFTETESLNGKLIDLMANSREDLLSKLNGQAIKRFDGSETRLNLNNPEVVTMEMSARQRFLSVSRFSGYSRLRRRPRRRRRQPRRPMCGYSSAAIRPRRRFPSPRRRAARP